MKKISIITICYNEPKLEETCKSIIAQSFQDFEWIVIDGGSNQETLNIFEKYKYHIDYFISEKDSGIYHAMNKGIKKATGLYLNFMNAGDCFVDNKVLDKVVSYLNKYSEKDILYGLGFVGASTKCIVKEIPENLTVDFLYRDSLFHQSMFFKKDLFEQFGGYDENYKIVADWKYYFKMYLKKRSFQFIDMLVAKDEPNGISITNSSLCELERLKVLEELFSKEELSYLKKNFIKYKFSNVISKKRIDIKHGL